MEYVEAVRNCNFALRCVKRLSKISKQENLDDQTKQELTQQINQWWDEANKIRREVSRCIGFTQFQNIQRALLKGEL